jgi:hypothetical protein
MCIFIYLHPLYHVIQPPILIYFARPILMGQNWGFEALDFEVVPIFRETKLDVIKENHPISLLNRPRCTGELAIWPSPKRWWGAGAGADIGMRDVRCYKVGKPWMIVYYFSLLPRMYIYIIFTYRFTVVCISFLLGICCEILPGFIYLAPLICTEL